MIKANTKFMREKYNSYLNSNYQNIFQAYEKPSSKKIAAWKYCQNLCNKYFGKDLKVVSKNTFTFTAGFISDLDGKIYFIYITPKNDRYIEL